MWTWLSISPGIAIAPPASITTSQADSCVAFAVPTDVILPSSMRIVSPAVVGLRQSPVTMVPRLTIAVFMAASVRTILARILAPGTPSLKSFVC